MKKRSILAILLAALLALTIFTGCAASTKSAAMDSSAPQAPTMEAPMEESVEAEEFAYDTVATTEAGSGAAETPEPDDSVADYTAKIIYTASVSIETTEFDKAVAALENQVQKIGGFVESSNVTGDTQYNADGTTTVVNRWAYYTVRIPCDHFESFLHETEGFGNVTSTSRDAQNVTSAYTDYEARLSSLNTQEERLLDMLAKSEDVETLIALEQRLSDVRYEIESIERNLRNYDMQIKYSTVNLDLREVEVYTPTVPVRRTFGQKLADSLSDGWNGFTRGIQNVILGLASALPALILLAVTSDRLICAGAADRIGRIDGIVMVALYIALMRFTIRTTKRPEAVPADAGAKKPAALWLAVVMIAGGLAGLIFGGDMFLKSATEIARRLGISESVIAITLVAGGTSLPELASSVVSLLKGKSEMALGNVIGSNIANILLILGVSATIRPLTMGGITTTDILMVVLSSLLLLLTAFTFRRKQIDRWEGAIFLMIYVAYIWYLIR